LDNKNGYPNPLYSVFFRAAINIHSVWCKQGKDQKFPTIKCNERLKGIRRALTFAIACSKGSERDALQADYIKINKLIAETTGGYEIGKCENGAIVRAKRSNDFGISGNAREINKVDQAANAR
jgi:hypothetical protein